MRTDEQLFIDVAVEELDKYISNLRTEVNKLPFEYRISLGLRLAQLEGVLEYMKERETK